MGLPQWLRRKESSCNVEDEGLIPGWGRSPGEGNGYPHQYSCWQIPRTSWVWYCIITFQIVPLGGNCSRAHRITLYYFLYPYVNLQLTQKKKFNLKIFTSSIFTDNILLNVVLKGHILISIFSLWMRIYKWRILTNLPSYALNLLTFYTVSLQVQHQGDEFSTPYELTFL